MNALPILHQEREKQTKTQTFLNITVFQKTHFTRVKKYAKYFFLLMKRGIGSASRSNNNLRILAPGQKSGFSSVFFFFSGHPLGLLVPLLPPHPPLLQNKHHQRQPIGKMTSHRMHSTTTTVNIICMLLPFRQPTPSLQLRKTV